jgi:hypothetical protein
MLWQPVLVRVIKEKVKKKVDLNSL